MINVEPNARTRADRAGEPLDGLVNMFDIGIVLAVGFLIAALHAVSLTTKVLTHKPVAPKTPAASSPKTAVKHNQKVEHVNKPTSKTVHVKSGKPIGQVYQLPNGQYVLVRQK